MSANNIVVFEEQADGTFKAYHRDMDAYYEGIQYAPDEGKEQPIFLAMTMRECIGKFYKWYNKMKRESGIIEYGYVFELRAGNEANPSLDS